MNIGGMFSLDLISSLFKKTSLLDVELSMLTSVDVNIGSTASYGTGMGDLAQRSSPRRILFEKELVHSPLQTCFLPILIYQLLTRSSLSLCIAHRHLGAKENIALDRGVGPRCIDIEEYMDKDRQIHRKERRLKDFERTALCSVHVLRHIGTHRGPIV